MIQGLDLNQTILSCSGSIDNDGDDITYYYYGDYVDGSTLLGVNDTTSGYNVTGLVNGDVYYWRCLASDSI